jgi:aminopeptidase N
MRDTIQNPINISNYNLNFTLDPNLPTFECREEITFKLTDLKYSQAITLHSKDLTITQASFYAEGGLYDDYLTNNTLIQELTHENITYDTTKDLVTFNLNKPLLSKLNNYKLKITYMSKLQSNLVGLYLTKSNNKNALVTQLESTDARRLFICIDEPNKKATFDVSLIIPNNFTGLSNTHHIISEKYDNNNYFLRFATTPIMSTYLLAIFVGEVDYTEQYIDHVNQEHVNQEHVNQEHVNKVHVLVNKVHVNKEHVNKVHVNKEHVNQVHVNEDNALRTRIRIYAEPSKKNQLAFALNIATRVLTYFETYFNSSYPLQKLDLIAINDFASGAMENWGLITFRSKILLVDENTTTLESKIQIAYVIAHEIAHQWFGNLVTMDWWSDLWLNEGFATWIGWDCINKLHPEWQVWEKFILKDYYSVLELDSLTSSHPIQNQVEDSQKITEIFDEITYEKGCCIIRMLEQHIGSEKFKLSIQKYLSLYSYKNATTEQLWDVLTQSTQINVTKLMNDWVTQSNYPIVNVKVKHLSNKTSIEVRQQNVTQHLNTQNSSPLNKNKQWTIPTLFKEKYDNNISFNVFQPNTTFLFSQETLTRIIKLNKDQLGFYRVKYDDEILEQFKILIKNKTFSPIDRSEIINNIFSFVILYEQPITKFLDYLSCYDTEDNYLVYTTMFNNINKLITMFVGYANITTLLHQLKQNIKNNILNNNLKVNNINNIKQQDHNSLQLQKLVDNLDIYNMSPTTANDILESYLNNKSITINPEQRSLIFSKALQHKTHTLSNVCSLQNLYLDLNSTPDLQQDILIALSRFNDIILKDTSLSQEEQTKRTLFRQTLDFCFKNKQKVKTQDAFRIFTFSSTTNNKFTSLVYLQENWDLIYNLYKDTHMFDYILSSTLSNIFDTQVRDVMIKFLETKDVSKFTNSITQSLEKAKVSSRFISRETANLEDWLTNNVNKEVKEVSNAKRIKLNKN